MELQELTFFVIFKPLNLLRVVHEKIMNGLTNLGLDSHWDEFLHKILNHRKVVFMIL